MYEIGNSEARPRKRWPVAIIAAGLLGAAALCQPHSARALSPLPLGDEVPGGDLDGSSFRGGDSRGREIYGAVVGGHHRYDYLYGYVDRDGHGWAFGGSYPDDGYDDDSQPADGQVWYDCSDPAGCLPYLTRRNPGSYRNYGDNDDSQPSNCQLWYDCSEPVRCILYLMQRDPIWQTVPAAGAVSEGGGSGGLDASGFHCP